MTKQLEIGKNYGFVFGLDEKKGQIVFLGGDSWKAIKPGMEKVMESADTTKKAIEYINRPTVHMGSM